MLIDAVGPARMPFVIFVTAFDNYALRAFDVHALDYLLEAVRSGSLPLGADPGARAHRAVDPTASSNAGCSQLVHGLKPPAHPLERFVVKASGRVFFVRASEIEWIEAAGNYVKLHVGAETHLFRETMNAVEEKLDPDLFYRIHRSPHREHRTRAGAAALVQR